MTLVLPLKSTVNPGTVNPIRIGIADAGDQVGVSAGKADNVQTALIPQDSRQ